jgi:4'-phosphopantetheinyl transferase
MGVSFKDPEPITWSSPVGRPYLNDTEVHLWRVDLNVPFSILDLSESCLSEAEVLQASKYVTSDFTRRYALSHIALRCILSKYLFCEPSEVIFSKGDCGKPGIVGSKLHFNLSHSFECAVIAVSGSLCGEVGVDVEFRKRPVDALSLAKRFFSGDEYCELLSFQDSCLIDVFYAMWTLKEAFIKCLGVGLSASLSDFTVTVASQADCLSSCSLAGVDAGLTGNSLLQLGFGGDYSGALSTACIPDGLCYFGF